MASGFCTGQYSSICLFVTVLDHDTLMSEIQNMRTLSLLSGFVAETKNSILWVSKDYFLSCSVLFSLYASGLGGSPRTEGKESETADCNLAFKFPFKRNSCHFHLHYWPKLATASPDFNRMEPGLTCQSQ